MLNQEILKKSLISSIAWFENSGVMDPADGSWGVGERVVLTGNNDALEKIFTSFPVYSEYGDYAVIEQRRPDCNFETALMFLLASDVLGETKYVVTARNLLHYLYCRSGMRNTIYASYPLNTWRWANEKWVPVVYFDDNAWNCIIPLLIASFAPDLDTQFRLRSSALLLAEQMVEAFNYQFPDLPFNPDRYVWHGDVKSPHWGSLACMAMACAYKETGKEAYKQAISVYHDYLDSNKENFTTSEHAYIVIGSAISAFILDDKAIEQTGRDSADRLLAKQSAGTGNIPSEWGREAPVGQNLVDTIYTQNWSVLGLQLIAAATGDDKYRVGFEKAFELVLRIQDSSPEKHLCGCWRGMYNLETEQWGGGNRFEGGADSIYSGWTNAPFSIVSATEIMGKTILALI